MKTPRFSTPHRSLRLVRTLLFAATITTALPTLQAQLMFNFGTTTPSGAGLTQSPGHATNAIASDLTRWNTIGSSSVSSLFYADGTAATGITINTGVEAVANSNIINFSLDPASGTGNASAFTAGIYSPTNSPSRGFIFSGSGATNDNKAVGVQISGLAAGTYEIYIAGRNTSSTSTYPTNFYAGVSSAGDTFNFSGLTAANVTNPFVASGTAYSWTLGETYQKITLTLEAGQVINLASDGLGTGATGRGFLNLVQIVAVIPEPSSVALGIAFALVGIILLRRRFRRSIPAIAESTI